MQKNTVETLRIAVTIYNPSDHPSTHTVRLRKLQRKLHIYGPDNQEKQIVAEKTRCEKLFALKC